MSNVNNLLKQYGPVDFEVCSVGPLESFDKKNGGTYEAHEVKIKTRSNGEIYTVRMFESLVNAGMIAGSLVRGTVGSNGYAQWELLPVGPASAAIPQPKNNSQQVHDERSMKNDTMAYNEEKMIHDWKLGLAGIVQSLLIRGDSDEGIKERAPEWAQWIRTEARRQASIDIASHS